MKSYALKLYCVLLQLVFVAFINHSSASEFAPKELLVEIDNIIQKTVKAQDIQGMSFAILVNGKLVHKGAYGYLDTENRISVTTDTIFPLASLTKLFVSSSLQQLLVKHNIAETTMIGELLPELPVHWQKITLAELLSHTSGLPDYYPHAPLSQTANIAIQTVASRPFEFKTGQKSQYIQTGFAVLQLLIERLSDKTLEQYLAEHHFIPLNLRGTFYDIPENFPGHLSQTYQKRWWGVKRTNLNYAKGVRASAGLYSSVDDLIVWMQALLRGQLLPKSKLEKMWTGVPLNNKKQSGFALGWEYSKKSDVIWVGHGGADTLELRHYRDSLRQRSVTIIWLSNTIGFDPHNIVNKLASLFIKGIEHCSSFLFFKSCSTN